MSMSQSAIKLDLKEFFQDRFRELESSLNGETASGWHQTRLKAMAQFDQVGLPGIKDEEYKYTPISKRLAQDLGNPNPVGDSFRSRR